MALSLIRNYTENGGWGDWTQKILKRKAPKNSCFRLTYNWSVLLPTFSGQNRGLLQCSPPPGISENRANQTELNSALHAHWLQHNQNLNILPDAWHNTVKDTKSTKSIRVPATYTKIQEYHVWNSTSVSTSICFHLQNHRQHSKIVSLKEYHTKLNTIKTETNPQQKISFTVRKSDFYKKFASNLRNGSKSNLTGKLEWLIPGVPNNLLLDMGRYF